MLNNQHNSSSKRCNMEPTTAPLYFDLGENPWTPKQKKIFTTLFALCFLAILWGVYRKYPNYDKLSDAFYPILYTLFIVLNIYRINRGRMAPLGHYFVDLNEGLLKFRGLTDRKIESFALEDIDYIFKEGRKIGFKPSNSAWHYIQAGAKAEAIFAQLQNLVEDLNPKPQIVNLNKK